MNFTKCVNITQKKLSMVKSAIKFKCDTYNSRGFNKIEVQL